MSINHNKVRPVYMNLFQIRLPISAISSITHRLAGIYIFFISLPLFLFLLYFTTKSYNDFMFIQQAFNNSIFFSTFVSFSFLVFAYHILTGVRHLLQDLHIGESLSASRISSYIVFILWFLLVFFLIWMFYLW
jgi:succinate dehydrogenase / fumarate reductase cytochrome b subunit